MVINRSFIKKFFALDAAIIIFDGLLISMLHLPGIISYIPDLMNVLIVIYLFMGKGTIKLRNITDKIVCLFVIWSAITALVNLVSPMLFLWEMRNFCRHFVAYYIFVGLACGEDAERIYQFLLKLQILNVVLNIYQYFILGFQQDFLGGIFGTESGVNASSNIFFCILCTLVITKYLQKQEKLSTVLWICASCMVIAAFAELKLFYIEFIAILILSVLVIRPSRRSVTTIAVALISVYIGLLILKSVFPKQYDYLMDIESLIGYADARGRSYGISRLHMMQDVNEWFFRNSILHKTFGLGMGACTMSSSFGFLTSRFYKIYKELNYNWFSHAMLYLQVGLVGLALYIGILFSFMLRAIKNLRKKVYKNGYEYFIIVFTVIMLINLMYNHWTRAESGYLVFLAYGFGISAKAKSNPEQKKMALINNRKNP